MMSIKLAFANVRKSFKDYLMYFITLTFSVALFYIFGSVDQQLSLIKILQSSDGIVANFDSFILGFSILVFIIFYFLVRYANNFLVKRRNQEFATYILLGMRNRTMAVILVIETLVIGVVSLIVGLIMGVALSQVTSVFTAFVLESDIEFSFIYSQAAFKNTIISFSIIFILVSFGNIKKIRKFKLVNLLNAVRQNDVILNIKPWFGYVSLLAGIYILFYAYRWALQPYQLIIGFIPIVFLGTLATLIIFYSIAHIFMNLITRIKPVYYRGTNMFVFRQLGTRIRSTYRMMTFISVIMLFSLVFLTTGINTNAYLLKSAYRTSPYTLSVMYDKETIDFQNYLSTNEVPLQYSESLELYESEYTISDFINDDKFYSGTISIVSKQDYDAVRAHFNLPPLDMNTEDVLLASDIVSTNPFNQFDSSKLVTEINLFDSPKTVRQLPTAETVILSNGAGMASYLIVENSVLEMWQTNGYINYNQSVVNIDTTNNEIIEQLIPLNQDNQIFLSTQENAVRTVNEIRVAISYTTLYLGVVFLISAMVVQSLHVMSDAMDTRKNYRVLDKLGVDDQEFTKIIRKQTLIYVTMPLVLALCHTLVGNRAVAASAGLFGTDATAYLNYRGVAVALVIFVCYLLYFYVLYRYIVGLFKERNKKL